MAIGIRSEEELFNRAKAIYALEDGFLFRNPEERACVTVLERYDKDFEKGAEGRQTLRKCIVALERHREDEGRAIEARMGEKKEGFTPNYNNTWL